MSANTRRLYADCDRELGSILEPAGFARVQPGEFKRLSAEGEDRILVDPDERKNRFSVLLSHYPSELTFAEAPVDPSEPRGFPCGPYLSPKGVGRREHMWPYGSQEALQKSLDGVKVALRGFGLPWLASLRDPRKFATEVDPVAALYAAAAHERAGDMTTAWRLYEEMYRRLEAGRGLGVSEAEFLRTAGREYVLVARRLGIDNETVRRFEKTLLDSARQQKK